jgi:hypothetical protein
VGRAVVSAMSKLTETVITASQTSKAPRVLYPSRRLSRLRTLIGAGV